ncbi:MAG TPA: PDZ domain-containing protein [Mycobacteriales bacterium]|jgi:PDZ domain-containing protein|nr:PDZ domain-containing protein [Mycobacteriales bacterium]
MTRRTYTLIVGVVIIIVLGVVAARLPVQYAAMGPGVTFNTLGKDTDGKQIVEIKGRTTNKVRGHLNMTTVSELDHLDVLSAIRGWLSHDEAVVPREVLFPPGQTDKQIQQQNAEDFVQSQDSATSAALSYLHYPNKVVVGALPDGSPSAKTLAVGDSIDTVDGTTVKDVDGLHAILTKLTPGTKVKVGFTHKHKPATGTITTTKAAKGAKGAALGISVVFEPVAPFDITISLANIGGPSAGLMFALGILEKVGTGGDLTGGTFIAGTGTIDPTGKVGAIGGIPLKMIGAKRAGAKVFLVPAANCAEAEGNHPSGLRLVKVSSLSGAVEALKSLQHGGNPPSC